MTPNRKSIAEASLKLSYLFESELLVELMLRFWQHPFADSKDFRSVLLETAVEALHASIGGSTLIEGVTPRNVNLVAAIWYAEVSSLPKLGAANQHELEMRQGWLDRVRRALPSCFCDPDRLI